MVSFIFRSRFARLFPNGKQRKYSARLLASRFVSARRRFARRGLFLPNKSRAFNDCFVVRRRHDQLRDALLFRLRVINRYGLARRYFNVSRNDLEWIIRRRLIENNQKSNVSAKQIRENELDSDKNIQPDRRRLEFDLDNFPVFYNRTRKQTRRSRFFVSVPKDHRGFPVHFNKFARRFECISDV